MKEVRQDWNSMDAMNMGKLLGGSPTSLYIQGLTGRKPHECREWRKSFSFNSQLVVCQRIHTGENLYVWNECEKAFNREDKLISHQWTHTGEKSYGCNECVKTFSSKSYLVINMRTHSGKKPYECHKCEKAFIWKSLLIVHEWTHAGENPYECSQCEKIFQWKILAPCISEDGNKREALWLQWCEKALIRKSKLIVHQRTHSGEKPYWCSECGKNLLSEINSQCISEDSYKRETL